jgi:stearoyl-CoA desaturase (delta-9 desaturase)
MIDAIRLTAMRFARWVVNESPPGVTYSNKEALEIDWLRATPFAAIHLGCLFAFATGVSATAVSLGLFLYVIRMFFITAFYHRYFSHRAYKVSRLTQFVMAVLGCTCGQRGPVWWAGHHRKHHMSSDQPDDPHSPKVRGFWFSHTIWFLTRGTFGAPTNRVRDWLYFPELRFLEKVEWLPFITLGAACYGAGEVLALQTPALGTSGAQMFVVGFLWSTVLLYHATYSTNSIAHQFGSRRFVTSDDSRNNGWVALLTLGEGWHNNHHCFPASARQGLRRWELDPTWWGLRALASVGIVRELKTISPERLASAQRIETYTGRSEASTSE